MPRRLPVGGNGSDDLNGNANDDVFIAGTTAHDDDCAALDLILAEWTSGRSYSERVSNLRGLGTTGANQGVVLTADGSSATVHDDGAVDRLQGAGRDWFLLNKNGDHGGAHDVLADLQRGETASDVDFGL